MVKAHPHRRKNADLPFPFHYPFQAEAHDMSVLSDGY